MNPCLKCTTVGPDQDKNGPDCVFCEKRVAYVGSLGSWDSDLPVTQYEPVQKIIQSGVGCAHREVEMKQAIELKEHKKKCRECESLKLASPDSAKSEFTRNTDTPDGFDSRCRECKNRIQNESRRRLTERKKKAKGAATPPAVEPPPKLIPLEHYVEYPATTDALLLDFSDHTDLLGDVNKIAALEFRTPAQQVLYWVHQRLEVIRQGGGE